MKRRRFQILLFGLLWCSSQAFSAIIEDVRVSPSPDKTRLVFELNSDAAYTLLTLANPDRVVVDFKHSRLLQNTSLKLKTGSAHIHGLRSAPRKQDYRVVIDAKQPLRPQGFILKPEGKYGYRLVVDLFPRHAKQSEKPLAEAKPSASVVPVSTRVVPLSQPIQPKKTAPSKTSTRLTASLVPTKPPLKRRLARQRDAVVVIDAGHGGEDPGAIGHRGSREKDLVLSIAKKIKKNIDQMPGMRAVLTRSGDYYLRLRERTRKARTKSQHADLFISIHADSFKRKTAHGSSVFILSNRGASSEAARWLANKENAVDLIGGVSLDDKDDVLATVLLDLSQTGTLEASFNAAQSILMQMERVGDMHKKEVQRAGFAVLKSPDIPSILIETAFISNPKEEKKLRSHHYQWTLANAIAAGIHDYLYRYPPLNTRVALPQRRRPKQYVIRRGDTLSAIASRYQVTINAIKRLNKLNNSRLSVGQILTIPLS